MAEIIVPPFTDPDRDARKVQIAEDLWNTRDPERVAAAYELWEFAPSGLMQRREASINDLPIAKADRRIL